MSIRAVSGFDSRGVTVVGSAERSAATAKAKELVKFARDRGYGRRELIELLQSVR